MKSNKITPEEALDLIQNGRAIARTIVSDPIDDHHWEFLINQFKDPSAIPSPRELDPNSDPNTHWHFYKKQWIQKPAGFYQANPSGAIQLLSGTLLPNNGFIYLYNHANVSQKHEHVVALFDSGVNPDRYLLAPDEEKVDTRIEPCIIKACFAKDAGTNMQWWVKGQPLNTYHNNVYPEAISFAALKNQNVTFVDSILNKGLAHDKNERNEVIFHPRLQGLSAISLVENSMKNGVNAIYRKMMVLQALKRDLPLLIMDGKTRTQRYAVTEQISDLVSEAEIGSVFILKIYALIAKLGGVVPEVWQSFLDKMEEKISKQYDERYYTYQSTANSLSSNLKKMYFHMLDVTLFKPDQKVYWKINIFNDYDDLTQDSFIEMLFYAYANGQNYAFRIIEMLEALNGAPWKEWTLFKNLLHLYGRYLQALHRFPTGTTAYDFYKGVYLELMRNSDFEVVMRGKTASASFFDRFYTAKTLVPTDLFAGQLFNQVVRERNLINTAIKSRLTWTDIVSKTDSLLLSKNSQNTIFAKMQKLKVPGDHPRVLESMVTYLQEKSVIMLSFDAKIIFQGNFISSEALNYDTAAALNMPVPDRGKDYPKARREAEDEIFSYLSSGKSYNSFEFTSMTRPRYAYFSLSNGMVAPPLPAFHYGKSYVVLQQKVKLNSLYVPHNIYAHRREALEEKKEYKTAQPCTYFTFETLLEQVPDDEFLMIADAVTGAFPEERFIAQSLDLQAYIPPVNLLDETVTQQLFVHPDEHVLTPIEKNLIDQLGIRVVNSGEHLGERDSKTLREMFIRDAVDELQRMRAQNPAWFNDAYNTLILFSVKMHSLAIYTYLISVMSSGLDLKVLAHYMLTLKWFNAFYEVIATYTSRCLSLEKSTAEPVLALLDKAIVDWNENVDAINALLFLIPQNTWLEVDIKTLTRNPCTFKNKVIELCLKKEDALFLQHCLEILYLDEQDLRPYHYDLFKSAKYAVIKRDLKNQGAPLNAAQIRDLIFEWVNQKSWLDLLNLATVVTDFKMPFTDEKGALVLELIAECKEYPQLLELCVATPGFRQEHRPQVLRLMQYAVTRSLNLTQFLATFFPAEFAQEAANLLATGSRFASGCAKLLAAACDFTQRPNSAKIAILKNISAIPEVHYLLDVIHPEMSEADVLSVIRSLDKSLINCTTMMKGFMDQYTQVDNVFEPCKPTPNNLAVFEEKTPDINKFAEALRTLKVKIDNKKTTLSHYAARLNEIISQGFTISEQKSLGRLLDERYPDVLQHPDIAELIAHHEACAKAALPESFRRFRRAIVYPHLMVVMLASPYSDNACEDFLLQCLLDPELNMTDVVTAYLERNPWLKPTAVLLMPLLQATNPDKVLIGMLCARGAMVSARCLLTAAAHPDGMTLLRLLLQSGMLADAALFNVLEMVLKRGVQGTSSLIHAIIRRMKKEDTVETPIKVRCWLQALDHPDVNNIYDAMEGLLKFSVLIGKTGIGALLTRTLRNILEKPTLEPYLKVIPLLLDKGGKLDHHEFTVLLQRHGSADLIASILKQLSPTNSNRTVLHFVLFSRLRDLLQTERENDLFAHLEAMRAYPHEKFEAMFTNILLLAIRDSKPNVLAFFIEKNLVRVSAALTEYLQAKFAAGLVSSQIDPDALRLAHACDWDMRSIFAAYHDKNIHDQAISSAVAPLAYVQHASMFSAAYALTSKQQETIQQFVAEKIHAFLDYPEINALELHTAMQQHDYIQALRYLPALQPLLEQSAILEKFLELNANKNKDNSSNLTDLSLSEIETHFGLMQYLLKEVTAKQRPTVALVEKIPALIQCFYALAKRDTPDSLAHFNERHTCLTLIMQTRDLVAEDVATQEEKSSANQELVINAETVTKIVTDYYSHKIHFFGRRNWIVNQDKNTEALLKKLEDATAPIAEKQQLLQAVLTEPNKVESTLFKVVNRNMPTHVKLENSRGYVK